MPAEAPTHQDGRILDPARLADVRAIEDLAIAYAYAVDDRDWARWEALFQPDGLVDYTRSVGIKGTPAEVAEWMVGAMATFAFTVHTTSTHQIRFTGPDTATGRAHVINRNGVEWNGAGRAVRRGRPLRGHLRAGRHQLADRQPRRIHDLPVRRGLRRHDPGDDQRSVIGPPARVRLTRQRTAPVTGRRPSTT